SADGCTPYRTRSTPRQWCSSEASSCAPILGGSAETRHRKWRYAVGPAGACSVSQSVGEAQHHKHSRDWTAPWKEETQSPDSYIGRLVRRSNMSDDEELRRLGIAKYIIFLDEKHNKILLELIRSRQL